MTIIFNSSEFNKVEKHFELFTELIMNEINYFKL